MSVPKNRKGITGKDAKFFPKSVDGPIVVVKRFVNSGNRRV